VLIHTISLTITAKQIFPFATLRLSAMALQPHLPHANC